MTGRAALALKCLIPGYRERWYRRAALFLDDLAAVADRFSFGWSDGHPTARSAEGLTFAGFATPPGDAEIYALLKPRLPATIGPEHFRLARDLVTRYLYPHLRADLAPDGGTQPAGDAARLTGYHGQQKDTALHIPDPARRARFVEAFRPKPDDVILDCGAFIGLGDAAVAPMLPQGRILALEADARCFALLERNLSANGFTGVTPCHGAIWNRDGETMAFATGEAQANTLVREVLDAGGRAPGTTRTADGLAESFGLGRITMLSLTVNGAEIEALEGAVRVLREHRPRIRLAGWYMRDGRPIAEHCRIRLEEAGYDVHVGPGLGLLALPQKGAR
jgi:FkbM family methyltransferase